MNKLRVFIFSSVILSFTGAFVFAEDNGAIRHIPGEGIELTKFDVFIKPSATFVAQTTPDPNSGSSGWQAGGSWVGYLGIAKKFADVAEAYLELRSGWGQTVQNKLDLFSNVNFNAYNVGGNVRLRIYYYEHYFFDHQLSILVGHNNPRAMIDQVKYANDDDTQFLACIFNRSPAIDWPSDFTPTIRAKIAPYALKYLELEYNYMKGDAKWKGFFKDWLQTVQLNFMPAKMFGWDLSRWDGNYRVYAWYNAQDHVKLVEALAAPSTNTRKPDYGFGLGFDQMLGEVFGVFGRLGEQRADVLPANSDVTVKFTWSSGMRMTGKYWKRDNDVLGLAVGQIFPSKRWADSSSSNHKAGEGHVEAYYSIAVSNSARISPDFQLIWHPNGVTDSSQGKAGPVYVYGLRANVAF